MTTPGKLAKCDCKHLGIAQLQLDSPSMKTPSMFAPSCPTCSRVNVGAMAEDIGVKGMSRSQGTVPNPSLVIVGAMAGDTRLKGRTRSQSTTPNPSSTSLPLTLHDEVDARCLGVIVCLHGAGVGALIVHVHVVDLDAVLGFGVGQEHHPRVQAPLVIAGIEDAAAVQPGHAGDAVVHGAPGQRQR